MHTKPIPLRRVRPGLPHTYSAAETARGISGRVTDQCIFALGVNLALQCFVVLELARLGYLCNLHQSSLARVLLPTFSSIFAVSAVYRLPVLSVFVVEGSGLQCMLRLEDRTSSRVSSRIRSVISSYGYLVVDKPPTVPSALPPAIASLASPTSSAPSTLASSSSASSSFVSSSSASAPLVATSPAQTSQPTLAVAAGSAAAAAAAAASSNSESMCVLQ
jgi:hypothetical protein